jgi:hypothetical protein
MGGVRRWQTAILGALVLVAAGCTPPTTGDDGALGCPGFVRVPLEMAVGPAAVSADGGTVAYPATDGIRISHRPFPSSVPIDLGGRPIVGWQLRLAHDGSRLAAWGPGLISVDVEAGTVEDLRVDLSGAPDLRVQAVSDDLTLALAARYGSTQILLAPTDGGPARTVTFPTSDVAAFGRYSDDLSTIASGPTVWRDGSFLSYPGSGAFPSVVDLARGGRDALVSTSLGLQVWNTATGGVTPAATAEHEVGLASGIAATSDDGRFIARYVHLASGDHPGVVDGTTHTAVPIDPFIDGFVDVSDDGRVVTSADADVYTCTG